MFQSMREFIRSLMNSKIKYFLITAVLATAILCSAGAVSAQTDNSASIVQLQAQIANLLAQIQTLQSQQSTTPTPPATPAAWCHTFNTNLGYANPGTAEVGYLHTALQKEDISYAPDTGNQYTGTNGKGTVYAVKQFQKKYGLTQIGYVGPATRKKLNVLYGCGTTPPFCTPNWQCGWGPCVNGYQSQVPVDSNNCGLPSSSANIVCTALTQACTPAVPSIIISGATIGVTYQPSQSISVTFRLMKSDGTPAEPKNHFSVDAGSHDAATGGKTPDGSTISTVSTYNGNGYWTVTRPAPASPGSYYLRIIGGCFYEGTCEPGYVGWSPSAITEVKLPYSVVTTTQPSITISDPSGNQGITVNAGSSFTIQGTPQNIQGLSYWFGTGTPPTGYYNRAFIFDPIFNSSCTNNDASSSVWTITCTPRTAGTGTIHVEIYANGQVYRSNNVTVTVLAATQPSITVTSPNGGETFVVGQTININWTSSGVNNVNVYLVAEGGSDVAASVAQNISASLGTYSWKIPNQYGLAPIVGKFKLYVSNGGTLYDNSDNYFSIVAPTTTPSITVTSPNGGEQWARGSTYNITWNSIGVNTVTIEIIKNDSQGWTPGPHTIYTLPASAGSYSWIVPTIPPGTDFKIKIYDTANASISDLSDNYFSIVAPTTTPSITVTSPNGGETFVVGQTININWTSSGVNNVNVYLVAEGGSDVAASVAQNISASLGTYSWKIPNQYGLAPIVGKFKLYVSNGGTLYDNSDNYFSIAADTGLACQLYQTQCLLNQLNNKPCPVRPAGLLNTCITPSYCISTPLPNLTVTKLSVYRIDSLNVGMDYCIKNIGNADAGKFYLKFYNLDNPSWDFGGAGFNSLSIGEEYCGKGSRSGVGANGGNGYISGNNRIQIVLDSNYEVKESNENDNVLTSTFNTAISTQPSITVTSPNGGESWAVGSTHNITWTSTGSIPTFYITYANLDQSYINPIASVITGKSYSWTIPSSLPAGRYSISITNGPEGIGTVGDSSNSNFTIVAATPTPTPVNGTCGAAATNYPSIATAFSGAKCGAGSLATTPASPAFPVAGSSTTWTCGGLNGGSSSPACTATRAAATPAPVNGTCGVANNVAVISKPTTNLCSTGMSSAVSGTGPWNWSCAGSNGGTNASCSAPVITAKPVSPNVAITDIAASQTYVYIKYVNNGAANTTGKFTIQISTSTKTFTSSSYSIPAPGVSTQTGGFALSLIGLTPGATANVTATLKWVAGTVPTDTAGSTFSKTIIVPSGATGLNVSQDTLASIAQALAKIVEQLQALLNKQ